MQISTVRVILILCVVGSIKRNKMEAISSINKIHIGYNIDILLDLSEFTIIQMKH